MTTGPVPREEVVSRLLSSFRSSGYEGASLSNLSSSTGLGKSSLYHHFPGGKVEMASAVLDYVDRWLQENIIAPLENGGSPSDRLAYMIAAVDSFYQGGRSQCILGAFAFGEGRSSFGPRLARAFERWIGALAAVARDAGVDALAARAAAEKTVMMIQGGVILATATGDPKPFRLMLNSLERELLGS